MKRKLLNLLVFTFLFCHLSAMLLAQDKEINIKGKVTDSSGDPLVGVNVTVKGKVIGTTTNLDGTFYINTKTPLPFTLIFSSVGFAVKEVEVTDANPRVDVQMDDEVILGQEIVISANRYEESILESSASIEKLSILDIQNTASADFYNSLRNLKGVDLGRQSLIFTTPNVRGFNSNTNYRVNQFVDGIDNAPPGLGFSSGNIVGISELDVESVELINGASSALYGPGGLNGVILMTSKSPFEYQGLSVGVRMGLMHVGADYQDSPDPMYDLNLRYAKSFNDKFAFKVNVSYLTAQDWQANDLRDNTDLNNLSLTRESNEGYDGVNTYGDEPFIPTDIADFAAITGQETARAEGLQPGTPEFDARAAQIEALFPESQLVTRDGYLESDLADYNTSSLKTNLSLHYRITENVELIASGGYNRGTAVYTASSRFSLVDFALYNAKLEVRGPKFFLRAWTTGENAGDTYDVGGVALQMNEAWKGSEQWYTDYINGFVTSRLLGNNLNQAYDFARTVANNRDANGNILNPNLPFRPLPGEPEFENAANQLRGQPISDQVEIFGNTVSGAGVTDKSSMYNIEGMYDFSDFFKFANIQLGFNHRVVVINSEGTIFADPIGDPHVINIFGAYIQVNKELLNKKLRFTGTARYDKNENFDGGRFTPRASLVYSIDKQRRHNIRGSIQSAFRFPSIADQYTNLNVGVFQVIGGLPQFRQPFNFDENPVYPLDNPNPLVGQPVIENGPYEFPEFKPERVVSYEIGYKGLITDRILLDAYAYYNVYNGFTANQALGQPLPDGSTRFFLSAVSTEVPIDGYGWAFSVDYKFLEGYNLSGNVSYNTLNSVGSGVPLGFLAGFNSPSYRTNLALSNRNVFRNIGFSVNWRWQNDFLWESTFGVGEVPAFHTLDAQITYKLTKLKTNIKVGGSNLLNQYYTTGFGNPQIGGLYYISLTFDEFLN